MSHKIIELETVVDAGGNVHIPEEYRALYGQAVRLIAVLAESTSPAQKMEPLTTFFSRFQADLTNYSFDREEANER